MTAAMPPNGVFTPFGTRAKQALSELAFGKLARVLEVTVDRYGRIVGRVYVDGIDVNRELVAQGYDWMYRELCSKVVYG